MLSAIPVLAVLGCAAQIAASKASYRYASVTDNYKGQYGEVVQRDVCVIGGGASGVHLAGGEVGGVSEGKVRGGRIVGGWGGRGEAREVDFEGSARGWAKERRAVV